MKDTLIAIDLAKTIFQVCVMNKNHEILLNKKLRRNKLLTFLSQQPPSMVVMEACYSSNPWGRAIHHLGHEVKLIPPYQVKPFVVGNKNDTNDAVAIAEAARRPKARFVPVKTLEQQDIQSLHRVRERCQRDRVAILNQLRGLLSEYGVVIPKTKAVLAKSIPMILEDKSHQLTTVSRSIVRRLFEQWRALDEDIAQLEKELAHLCKQHQFYDLLISIPGVGPLGCALILASVNDPGQFNNSRQFAAWLGLTPKQHASGDKSRMLGISKRGNASLRKTLIHGARTVLNWCDKKDDTLSLWLQRLKERVPACKLIVALANKLARIIWAVLFKQQSYDARLAAGCVVR